jgi:hypothetical protein
VVAHVSLSTPQSIMSICSWKASAHSAGMFRRRRVMLSSTGAAQAQVSQVSQVRSGQVRSAASTPAYSIALLG